MMKATPKFNKDSSKWTIDIETEEGEILPVGTMIDDKIGMYIVSEWNTKKLAEEWIKTKPKILTLGY